MLYELFNRNSSITMAYNDPASSSKYILMKLTEFRTMRDIYLLFSGIYRKLIIHNYYLNTRTYVSSAKRKRVLINC